MKMRLKIPKSNNSNAGLFAILLPWICIIAFESSGIALCTFLFLAIGMLVFGKFLLETINANFTEEDKWLLSLPTGYLSFCGLTALAVRLGVSSFTVFWAIGIPMVIVSIWYFIRHNLISVPKIQGLWALVPLSLIIALLYYLPGAIRDAVYLPDGSYNWMYVDTQFFHAVASSVKSSIGVPRMPGTSTIDLTYHFGPYGIAGILSEALDISVGDALVRVVRPIALLSLLLSAYAAGRFLGRGIGREATGGILAVAGLFFYGSIVSFLDNPVFTGLTNGNILSETPLLIPSYGGIFAHLVLGHSQVHGMNALLVLVLVLFAKLQSPDKRNFNPDISALGPAIIFPSSILLGFASLGLYAVLFLWFGRQYKRTLLTVGIAVCAAILSAKTMGYIGALSSGNLISVAPSETMLSKLLSAFVWFYLGLGVRVYAFTKIRNPFQDHVSATLIILFTGLVATSMFIPDFDSRYGFLYAQGVLNIFSFAWLTSPLHAAIDRNWSEVFSEVQKVIRIVLISGVVFLICAITFHFIYRNIYSDSSDMSLSAIRTIKYSSVLVLFSAVGLLLFNKSGIWKPLLTTCMICLYSFGFTAWVTDWENYGLGRQKKDITMSKGEVYGLEVLREVSHKGDMLATNQHSLSLQNQNKVNRSFGYEALSERPVFIEGWDYSSIRNTETFKNMLKDNELIFTSNDAASIKSVIDKYRIKYIVAKPGTDLDISNALPHWLTKIENTGSLNIYSVSSIDSIDKRNVLSPQKHLLGS